MFISTRGIVFRQIKYSDTSLIVKIFTEEKGLGSYIIKGARGSKSRIKASLFQPLNLLELVVGHNDKSDLQYVKEARVAYAFREIPDDIRKSSILLFINELLYKTIQEEAANQEFFQFIYDEIVMLDQAKGSLANFPLAFTVNLTYYLGLFPQGEYHGEHTVFDLGEGHFLHADPLPAENFITGSACYWLNKLVSTPAGQFFTLQIPAASRLILLEKMLRYFHLHLPLTGEFKSHIVLHEVLQK